MKLWPKKSTKNRCFTLQGTHTMLNNNLDVWDEFEIDSFVIILLPGKLVCYYRTCATH